MGSEIWAYFVFFFNYPPAIIKKLGEEKKKGKDCFVGVLKENL